MYLIGFFNMKSIHLKLYLPSSIEGRH